MAVCEGFTFKVSQPKGKPFPSNFSLRIVTIEGIVPPIAVNVTTLPLQYTGEALLVILMGVGASLTNTSIVLTLVQVPSFAVTVYLVSTVGETLFALPV